MSVKKFFVRDDQAVWERTTFEVEIPEGTPEPVGGWEQCLSRNSDYLYFAIGSERAEVKIDGVKIIVSSLGSEIECSLEGIDRETTVEAVQ
jgi:hypothetical protein